MKIAVAQIKPVKADILENIKKHKILIELAANANASAIFFPELSITGYEPELAASLATTQDDKIFESFQEISNSKAIVIGVGMPTIAFDGIQISMIIFQPQQIPQTYSKQILHTDEFPYFIKGNSQTILSVDNLRLAPAICYESLQAEHADNASAIGANIYIAIVAKSQKGIEKAYNHYPYIAQKYSMPVLLSNSVGPCDNYISAGRSAVWTKRGELAGSLDAVSEGIIIFDTDTEEVSKVIL